MVGFLLLPTLRTPQIDAGTLIHGAGASSASTILTVALCLVTVIAVVRLRGLPPFRFLASSRTRSCLGSVSFVIFAALNLQIDLSTLIHRNAEAPPGVTCHIATVSYRFVGDPGSEFRYDGDTWHVPRSGSIELIA